MAVNADLNDIRTKVRRLTRSPSSAQLTDDQIDDYVNTFVLYDLPEHLRLNALNRNLTWYCEPYIDTYATDSVPGLTDFKNINITVDKPIYVAGYQALISQSQEEFYGIYPKLNSILATGYAGDGATTSFSGTLSNFPLLLNNVLFDSIDTNNNGLVLTDTPSDPFDGTGTLSGDGTGTINYITGAFTLNFSTAPASGQIINSQTVPYVASRPQAVLFFNNSFTLRPVPDQPYRIDVQVYVQPTELIDAGDVPDLNQWWQYIAYGAAKKVFEDRTDNDSVQGLMPEFKMQERLVLRTTIVDQTKERSPSIYVQQTGWQNGGFWGNSGSI